MDTKDRATVWAGLLTLAFLQLQDRVDAELNLYQTGWVGATATVVYYALGFFIVFAVIRWGLDRYLTRRSHPQHPNRPPARGSGENPKVVGERR